MAARHWVSLALAVAATAGAWNILAAKKPEYILTLMTTFSSVSATLLGFLIAALSILIALVNKQLVSNMQKTGHYESLVRELFVSSVAYFVTLTVSMVVPFLGEHVLFVAGAVATGTMVLSTAVFAVAGHRFYKVMVMLD